MKNKKILGAAIAATMLVSSACGLVACDKDAAIGGTTSTGGTGGGYEITFVVESGASINGKSKVNTNKEGIIQGTVPDAAKANNTFMGWTISGETAVLEVAAVATYKFDHDTTLNAVFEPIQQGETGVFTINFNYGEGSGTTTSAQTVGGKLTTLPTPNAPDGKTFDAWYTGQNGTGTKVDTSTPFTGTITIYANYTSNGGGGGGSGEVDHSQNGLYVGSTCYALTRNTGSTTREEYWFGGVKYSLTAGSTVSIYLNGEIISAYVETSSVGVDKSVTDTELTEFTITTSGEFEMYLHHNENDWSVQFLGPTTVEISSDIPAGCAKSEITFANGTVTLYFVDVDGNAVGDLSKVAVYTYNDEAFGDWNTSKTQGKLTASKTATVNIPNGWVFRWGNFDGDDAQSSDIVGAFKAGKTYVVELKTKSSGADCVIKEVNV